MVIFAFIVIDTRWLLFPYKDLVQLLALKKWATVLLRHTVLRPGLPNRKGNLRGIYPYLLCLLIFSLRLVGIGLVNHINFLALEKT